MGRLRVADCKRDACPASLRPAQDGAFDGVTRFIWVDSMMESVVRACGSCLWTVFASFGAQFLICTNCAA